MARRGSVRSAARPPSQAPVAIPASRVPMIPVKRREIGPGMAKGAVLRGFRARAQPPLS